MNKNKASFELLRLQSQVDVSGLDKVETMAFFLNKGTPLEVVTRMDSLWDQTVLVGRAAFKIGKVIIGILIRFVKENPKMSIGLAVGVGFGMVASAIPVLGHVIAPIAKIILGTYYAIKGHNLDKVMKGESSGNDSIIDGAITLIKRFWDGFCEIFRALIIEPVMDV